MNKLIVNALKLKSAHNRLNSIGFKIPFKQRNPFDQTLAYPQLVVIAENRLNRS